MLAIRLQRLGRKGLPQYRVIVQDADRAPSSGRVVAYLGHYNPHTKEVVIDKEKATEYLNNGAQPSERVVSLLKDQGVKMPKWVKKPVKQSGTIKNPEKLRKNQPQEENKAEEAPAEEQPTEDKEQTEEPAPEADSTEKESEEPKGESDKPEAPTSEDTEKSE